MAIIRHVLSLTRREAAKSAGNLRPSWRPIQKNPRTHAKRKIRDLAAAIREVGFVTPIIVDENNMILAGHARWQAAQLLGLASIPTICAAGMRKEHIELFVLADNKFAECAGWDRPKLMAYLEEFHVNLEPLHLEPSLTGFEAPEIDFIFEDHRQEEPEPAYIVTTTPLVTRKHDLWVLKGPRILCGDPRSQDDLQRLTGKTPAAAMFTETPCNVRVAGHVQGRGKITHNEFAFASPPAGADKIIRLHAQSAIFENGRVFLPKRAPWLADYVAELTGFPGTRYADQVDSTTQALYFLTSKRTMIIITDKMLEMARSRGYRRRTY